MNSISIWLDLNCQNIVHNYMVWQCIWKQKPNEMCNCNFYEKVKHCTAVLLLEQVPMNDHIDLWLVLFKIPARILQVPILPISKFWSSEHIQVLNRKRNTSHVFFTFPPHFYKISTWDSGQSFNILFSMLGSSFELTSRFSISLDWIKGMHMLVSVVLPG